MVSQAATVNNDQPHELNPQEAQQAVDLALGNFSERHNEAVRVASAAAFEEFTRAYALRVHSQRLFPVINTAGQLLAHVMQQGKLLSDHGVIDTPFVLDDFNLDVYQQLASYFSGDYSTFRSDLNPHKGILLFGDYGCGKSLAMRLFSSNPKQSFKVIPARQIAESFRRHGDVSDYRYRFSNNSASKFFGHPHLALCIDDLGAENEVSHFQNTFSVGELIQDRYDDPLLRGWTHAATNGTTAELREAYGPRVYDRLRAMFNVVEFPEQPSRRV